MSESSKPEINNPDASDTPKASVALATHDHPKKCPLHKSTLQIVINLLIVIFGTLGLYYLNLWFAISYLIVFVLFFALIMPVKACQYCYFKIEELTLEQWKEEYGDLHEASWKKYGIGMFALWLLPIIGISISFFIEFEIVALVALILFISMLVISQVNLRKNICSKCEMLPICPLHNKE